MTMVDDVGRLRDELLALGTATLYEASGIDCFLPSAIQPAWPGAEIVGSALPVKTVAGDNLPIHRAIEIAQTGDVLVVDAAATAHGYWGEVLAVAAQERGVVGLVIDGGVRDTRQLEALGFPVFSRWTSIEGTLKGELGIVGAPVQIGNASIARGDVVVADRDGIVVLPCSRLFDIIESARSRSQLEAAILERIRAGELTLDIYGLRR